MKRTRTFAVLAFVELVCISLPLLCAAGEQGWTGSWYAAPVKLSPQFSNVTLRTVVRLTVGGDRLRLRLSNAYGRTALKVGEVYVAAGVNAKPATFNGKQQVLLLPGTVAVSDPVDLKTLPGEDLSVAVFYPETVPQEMTIHGGAGDSITVVRGNKAHEMHRPGVKALRVFAKYFLAGVDIESLTSRGTIVALGDSITDGGDSNWPALLARRLSKEGKDYGVLNAAIGGNRLLSEADEVAKISGIYGQSALIRFDRDVIDQPGIRYVIVYEGINDLGLGKTTESEGPSEVTTSDIVEALRHLARRAHQHEVKIYVATIAPFEGAALPGYYSLEKEKLREEINKWIRTSEEIDGYFDFARALSDPARPNRMNQKYDSGDHVHPNGAGQEALSESIDLSRFE